MEKLNDQNDRDQIMIAKGMSIMGMELDKKLDGIVNIVLKADELGKYYKKTKNGIEVDLDKVRDSKLPIEAKLMLSSLSTASYAKRVIRNIMDKFISNDVINAVIEDCEAKVKKDSTDDFIQAIREDIKDFPESIKKEINRVLDIIE